MLAGMRVSVCGEPDRARFDAAVARSPRADVLQSWAWGELKRSSGWVPLRLIVEDDGGVPRAACSVLRRRLAPSVPPILYAPRGPVWSDDAALAALVAEIRRRASGAFVLKCDPPVEAGDEEAAALARAGFRPVGGGSFGGVQPVAVMVLDLSPGPERVFEGFKSKWRYNVRLAERRGVKVREGTRDDLAAFYGILVSTARRDGFTVRARTYFERMWDLLAPDGMLRLFVAELEGAPVAAILCMAMGERVIYNYGGFAYEHREAMPNHLIHWSAIRWAADAGYRVYDFRGVSPVRDGRPVEEALAGLNRFKEGFGARYVEYAGELDLPLRPAWYAAWRAGAPAAMALRRRLHGGREVAE